MPVLRVSNKTTQKELASMKVTCCYTNGDEYDYDLNLVSDAVRMAQQMMFEFSIGEKLVLIRKSIRGDNDPTATNDTEVQNDPIRS
jgi:hypothetical protein